MGFVSKMKKLKGDLKSRLLMLRFQERYRHQNLFEVHAELYNNLYELKLVEKALNVGDKLPVDSVTAHDGSVIDLKPLLEKGPLILAFFRGTWCAYCNTEVTYLQENLVNFNELNANIIAISPQSEEHTKSMIEQQGITYPIVSDHENAIARKFGLTYNLTDEVVAAVEESLGINLRKFYGKDVVEVPLPATYVIGQDGIITYAFIEEDHRKRAEISEILMAARKHNINKQDYLNKACECSKVVHCMMNKVLNRSSACQLKKSSSEKKKENKKKEEKGKLKIYNVSTNSFSTSALLYCLENKEYLDSFQEYLTKTYCMENLLFYFETRDYYENFESMAQEERLSSAQRIYDNYVKVGTELEVNIDDHTREALAMALKSEHLQQQKQQPLEQLPPSEQSQQQQQQQQQHQQSKLTRDLFHDANQEVFKVMESDSFRKWRRTKEFDYIWKKNGSPSFLSISFSFLH